jgi:heptosyltransferase-2
MKILIVCGGGIGDLLMTSPMFRAINQAYPSSQVSVLIVQSINASLLAQNPFVNQVIDWNIYKANGWGLINRLKQEKFDYVIHNHSCPRWRFYLIPFLAKITNRFGFDRTSIRKGWKAQFQKTLLTKHIPYKAKSELRTRMNLDILKLIKVFNDDLSYDLHLSRAKMVAENRIGIHPGSDGRGAIKRWPAQSFMEMARKLVSEQGQTVQFFLGPAELNLKSVIVKEKGIEIVEAKSIADLALQMSTCSIFVSNDSGLSHIAAALKLPTVVLFGPTSPEEYIVPTRHVNVSVEGYDCTDCFRTKTCNKSSPTCMKTISVKKVLEVIGELQLEDVRA